jgi:hypothetical protein
MSDPKNGTTGDKRKNKAATIDRHANELLPAGSLGQHGLLYTESAIGKFLDDHRFLAAAQAYSMNLIPLGEAIVRAAEAKPYYPNPQTLQIAGYVQLFHEIAERISDGRIRVPGDLRQKYHEIYDGKGHKDPNDVIGFSARDFLKFTELRQPGVKKKMLGLFRREFDEEDVRELTKDKRLLAAIDAYGKGRIDLMRIKEIVFGDFDANPRDLSFLAFQQLCFEVVHQIRDGLIQIPPDFEEEFAGIYHPPPTGSS